MARVLVTGPAGISWVCAHPEADRSRARSTRFGAQHPSHALPSVDVVLGDVSTGDGLLEAVAGVDVVIHAATSPFRRAKATDIDGTGHTFCGQQNRSQRTLYTRPSSVSIRLAARNTERSYRQNDWSSPVSAG